MAQFIGLVSLNAGNFDSGAATDGQVLTADGAGGTAFEDAAGGGFQQVTVASDWSDIELAWADISAVIGLVRPPVLFEPRWYYICVWEGPTDPDDTAMLYIANDPGDTSYGYAFDSVPSIGTVVRIMGMRLEG